MAHRAFLALLFTLACLFAGQGLPAQTTPVAGPFQISPRSFDLDYPGLTDEENGFWVVWKSPSATGPLIRVSHYSTDGLRLGSARIGASRDTWRIHMNRRGDIAFVWTEPDGRVLLQVFDRFLVPRGKRQWVTRAENRPWRGDVAIGDTGRVLVAWVSSRDIHTPDGGTYHPLVGKLWQVEDERASRSAVINGTDAHGGQQPLVGRLWKVENGRN